MAKKQGNPKGNKSANLPFYYFKDAQMTKRMGSLPWTDVMGNVPELSLGNFNGESYPLNAFPGIFTMRYYPAINADGSNSHADRSATAFYNYVSQGFTTLNNFAPADMLMAVLAGQQVFCALVELKRAFGLTNYFLQFNNYYAKPIVQALGFNYQDLATKKKEIVTRYNILVDEINKVVKVPKDFFIGDRWEFLSSTIFSDVPSPEKAPVYAFKSAGFLEYDATSMNTGTSLHLVDRGEDIATSVDTYFTLLNNMVSKLSADTDVRNIFGAISRVYSDDQLKKASYLTEDFCTGVSHYDVMQNCMHNMEWVPVTSVTDARYIASDPQGSGYVANSIPIYQDSYEKIRCTYAYVPEFDQNYDGTEESYPMPIGRHEYEPGFDNVLLDLTVEGTPDADLIIDATAHKVCVGNVIFSPDGGQLGSLLEPRTEIITSVTVWYRDNDGQLKHEEIRQKMNYETFVHQYHLVSNLNYHPFIYMYDDAEERCVPIGEIDNYSIVPTSYLKKINRQCMYDMLMLPENSKSVTK